MSQGQQDPQSSGKARTPPHSDDAEKSVLGAILLEPTALDEVAELVKPGDFYRTAHGKVFEAMLALSSRNEPVDRVTVKDELTRTGAFEGVGGDNFLDLLDKITPVSTNVSRYAGIVADRSLRRRVIEISQNVAREGYEGEGTARDFAEAAEQRLFAASTMEIREGFSSVGSLIGDLQRSISGNYERGGQLTGAPTGITALDETTTGYQLGDLAVIGARPSMGKSALMLDAARAIAKDTGPFGGTVAIFSLEMPKLSLMLRLAAAEARIDLVKLRLGRCSADEFGRLMDALKIIEAMPIEIDDTSKISMGQIRASVRRLAAKLAGTKRPLRAVIVDYLQIMNHGQRDNEREDQAISRTTAGMKALAKDLKLAGILLSQLNRSVEKRPDKRPMMSDLRECGSLEQDADLILFPYRPEIYGEKCEPGEAEIGIAKQRNGPVGMVKAAFIKSYATFVDADRADGRPQQSGLKFTGHRPPPHTDADAP